MWILALALVLSVKVYPQVSLPPATVRITVTIPKDPDNRYRAIVWADADGELGRSEKSLDGDHEAVTFQFLLDHLGPGEYQVVVVVTKRDGSQQRAETRFIVGGGP